MRRFIFIFGAIMLICIQIIAQTSKGMTPNNLYSEQSRRPMAHTLQTYVDADGKTVVRAIPIDESQQLTSLRHKMRKSSAVDTSNFPMVSEMINGEMTVRHMSPTEAQSFSKSQNRRASTTMTINTDEGVAMTFMVLSEDDKTCQVGTGEGSSAGSSDAAIDKSYNGTVTIPSEVNGYKVVQIGNGAFFNCSAITGINIPNTVESINFCAFNYCRRLTSVFIPAQVSNINFAAFQSCSALESLTVDADNKKYDSRNNCNAIVETGANMIVAGCKNSIIFDGIKRIQNCSFFGCTGLTTLVIPPSVTYVGGQSFSDCYNLTSVVVESNNGTYDSRNNCNAIINTYDNKLVTGCQTTVIPETVTSIGSCAFAGQRNLVSITLPSDLWAIASRAFENCSSLISVTALMSTPFDIESDVFYNYGVFNSAATLYVPEGTKSAYQSARGWKEFTSIEEIGVVTEKAEFTALTPEGVSMKFRVLDESAKTCQVGWFVNDYTYSSYYACVDGSTSGSITIPSEVNGYTVVKIAGAAFYWLPKVTDITIPNTITEIGQFAFVEIPQMSSLHLPASVKTIMTYSLADATGRTIITVDPNNTRYDSRDNCNAVIETSSNQLIAGCATTVIPSSVTRIASAAFYGCDDLYAVTITKSINDIGSQSFSYCYNLETLDVEEGNDRYDSRDNCHAVIETANNSFVKGGGKSFVPESVTSIETDAIEGNSILEGIALPAGLSNIKDNAIYNCANLNQVVSYIQEPFGISKTAICKNSSNLPDVLYVPAGRKAFYEAVPAWNQFPSILEMDGNPSVSLIITDEKGDDITDNCQITWFDAISLVIGRGKTLYGVEDGTEVFYSVSLDEELGRTYREIDKQRLIVGEEAVTCQLSRIEKVLLTGRVSAADIDWNTATVNIRQLLNGKYEENFVAQTDEKGEFSAEVYDDVTDISISLADYYETTLHRDRLYGDGNLGVIPMKRMSYSVAADLIFTKVKKEGEIVVVEPWTDGLNNIDFVLTNESTGMAIEQFIVEGNNIVITNGAEAGNTIKVNAQSKQKIFANASATFTLSDEKANMFTMTLIELGSLGVTSSGSSTANSIGLLFGSNDELVARAAYSGDEMSMTHLPSGSYKLASLMKSDLLGNINSIAVLESLGLNVGTDYLMTEVTISDGEHTKVEIDNIPSFDESVLSYTTGNTYFNATKTSVMVDNYVTLNAKVNFKEDIKDNIDNVVLVVDLPETSQMVAYSAMIGGRYADYTLDGQKVCIPLSKSDLQEKVKFCIIPNEPQKLTVSAYVIFDSNGSKTQPIGTSSIDVKALTISAPTTTSSNQISISGTSKAWSTIRIYDNDVLIGTTNSKADGTWSALCELYKAYNFTFHNLHAKTTSASGDEYTSEILQVLYDKNVNRAKSVKMIYYNPEFDKTYNIEFDLINGATSQNSYYFFPYSNWPGWWITYETESKDFTFVAEFEDNNPNQIEDVRIKVLASDGTIRTLPAVYDANMNGWVATTKYTQYKLPQNATVEFEYIPELTDNDREESMLDQGTNLAACVNRIYQVIQEKATILPVSDTEESVTFDYTLDEAGDSFVYRIDKMDFAEAEKMMEEKQFTYVTDDEGGTGTYLETVENGISVVAVDLSNNYAFRITLTGKKNIDKSQRRAFNLSNSIKALKTSFSNGLFISELGDVAGAIGDIMGLTEYLSVKSDFDNMCDLILKYNDTYEKLRKSAMDAILAKCPDGSFKVSKEKREQWWNALNALSDSESAFTESYYQYLHEYKVKLGASVITMMATLSLGKGLDALGKSAKFITSKPTQWLLKHMSAQTAGKTAAGILTNLIGTVSGQIIDGIDKIFGYKDFEGVKDNALSWAQTNHNNFLKDYAAIKKGILDDYKSCEKQPDDDGDEEEFDDDSNDNRPDFPAKPTNPMHDPSGYVYEAVLSNRLPGVTTTVYQQEGGLAVQWNAEDYSQQNPLVTDDYGFYRWDVPMGNWQVKYEKEGYETTYSEWLPVPPPQLDVNVGMKQSTPPAVDKMRGYTSGITIDMSKYMLPATMNGNTITVTRNGMATNGTIEALDLEKAPTDEAEYVSKVKFVPEMAFSTSDEVVVTVHKEVESYCGVQMTADHVETVKIEADIEDLLADSVVTVSYQDAKEIQIVALPKQAVAGKKLQVLSSSPMIASLDAQEATFDDNGTAAFTVSGNLPGSAYLTFSIENTDLSAQTRVKVVMDNDLVATPEPSIKSGSTVEAGAQLVLTCATEGATIYYTLDGSCPCDEATRIKYESPIVINTGVVIKAIAVKDGMTDSDVATFVYVMESTGIRSTEAGTAVSMYCENGMLVIEGAEGGSCHVYDYEGRELAARSQLSKRAVVRVPKAKGYIVSVQVGNDKALVRKVLLR